MYQPVAFDDEARVAALRRYDVLDGPQMPELDAVTRLASRLTGAPYAAVALLDEHRECMPSFHGRESGSVPREMALSEGVVRSGRSFFSADLSTDPAFAGHAVMSGASPAVRMYGSALLVTPDGQSIGTLCVMDAASRTLDDDQLEALQDLADHVIHLFEARRNATRLRAALGELSLRASQDGLTGLANRDQIVHRLNDVAQVHRLITVLYADLDLFGRINAEFGEVVGDEVLTAVAARLRAGGREGDLVGRIGGDSFVLAVDAMSEDAAAALAERVRTLVREQVTTTHGTVFVDVSIGWAHSVPGEDALDLLRRAEAAMNDHKMARRGPAR